MESRQVWSDTPYMSLTRGRLGSPSKLSSDRFRGSLNDGTNVSIFSVKKVSAVLEKHVTSRIYHVSGYTFVHTYVYKLIAICVPIAIYVHVHMRHLASYVNNHSGERYHERPRGVFGFKKNLFPRGHTLAWLSKPTGTAARAPDACLFSIEFGNQAVLPVVPRISTSSRARKRASIPRG